MTEILLGVEDNKSTRRELVDELNSRISWDLFSLIIVAGSIKSEHESFEKSSLRYDYRRLGYAPFEWTLYAEKRSWRKWFLKSKVVLRCVVLRITYGEPRLLNGIYTIPGSESLKCELFRDTPEIRNIIQVVLGSVVDRIGIPSIEYISMSHNSSALYPGERPELPKARLLKV